MEEEKHLTSNERTRRYMETLVEQRHITEMEMQQHLAEFLRWAGYDERWETEQRENK